MSVTRIICEVHKCAVVHCGCSHPAVAYSIEQTPPIITTNVCPWTDNQQQCYWHEHDLCQPGIYANLTAGKKSAFVGITESSVTVVAMTAATRHGYGKTFHGSDAIHQALAAYKSPEMRAMIQATDALNK